MSQNRRRGENGSRAERRRRARRSGSRQKRRRWIPWVVSGFLAVGLVGAIISSVVSEGGTRHPEPRSQLMAQEVVSPARYASFPRVEEGYRAARRSAAALDGIFCYCFCSQHAGHYSLLDCFKDDHAARCDVCLSEAALVDRMSQDAMSLDRIREAVDETFGT